MKYAFSLFVLLGILPYHEAFAQCIKNTECKANHVCKRKVCATSPPPPQQTKQTLPTKAAKSTHASAQNPKFEDFPVIMPLEPWVLPKDIYHLSTKEWKNANGKLIESPKVNFAGKYVIILNSCGTGCRYYTLTDLSTGRDLPTLKIFGSKRPPATTKEGFTYVTNLVGRNGSTMLVAQYQIETETVRKECRERVFVFENEKLRPITKTKKYCSLL